MDKTDPLIRIALASESTARDAATVRRIAQVIAYTLGAIVLLGALTFLVAWQP